MKDLLAQNTIRRDLVILFRGSNGRRWRLCHTKAPRTQMEDDPQAKRTIKEASTVAKVNEGALGETTNFHQIIHFKDGPKAKDPSPEGWTAGMRDELKKIRAKDSAGAPGLKEAIYLAGAFKGGRGSIIVRRKVTANSQ